MNLLEAIQIRISVQNEYALRQELINQLCSYYRKNKHMEIQYFRHETIENDICFCIRYRTADNGRDSFDRLGPHLASCLKPFGEVNLSSWIQEDFDC